jgi:long-chain acyl-CoA synthetase
MASNIGRKSLSNHIQTVCSSSEQLLPQLKRVVLLQSPPSPSNAAFDKSVKEVMPYSTFVSNGHSVFINNATLRRAERRVKSSDVVNLQFTSGTSIVILRERVLTKTCGYRNYGKSQSSHADTFVRLFVYTS